ncbi:exodeoxyribonuclease V gamma chain [Photobacterium aphoticum]|uniref:Exodeoxyribonuclease V gamma chain n=1 Tax=Photobacterium aphoticum TaxID=754436 RepID=A0A090QZK4_9GAMM|nr:exodeoxyribonuclease V gamma chain [Photobacterium aphoticum]
MAECFNDSYLFPGEGNDTYIARVWPQWNDELAQAASQLAGRVLQAAILGSEVVDDDA